MIHNLQEIHLRSVGSTLLVIWGQNTGWIFGNVISYRQNQNEQVENKEKMPGNTILQKGVRLGYIRICGI
jgi:hypothetical protein